MTALILGATGLTGSHLLDILLADGHYEQVITITRKPLNVKHEKHVNIINSLERPEDINLSAYSINVLFSCLGTTRKKTPDLKQYKHIEVNIPEKIAEVCIPSGLRQIHLISAVGVNDKSRNFYISIKHQAESAIKKQPAGIQKFIYRPSLIMGDRKESRFLESLSSYIFRALSPLFSIGRLKRYKAVTAGSIARAMLHYSLTPTDQECTIVQNEMITEMDRNNS